MDIYRLFLFYIFDNLISLKYSLDTYQNIYKIEKYIRYAQPFTVILLVILGVIIASRKSRQGTGYLIALGFTFAFAFIIFFVMSRAFAENGSIDPLFAIWLPNLIFGLITVIIYRKMPK